MFLTGTAVYLDKLPPPQEAISLIYSQQLLVIKRKIPRAGVTTWWWTTCLVSSYEVPGLISKAVKKGGGDTKKWQARSKSTPPVITCALDLWSEAAKQQEGPKNESCPYSCPEAEELALPTVHTAPDPLSASGSPHAHNPLTCCSCSSRVQCSPGWVRVG